MLAAVGLDCDRCNVLVLTGLGATGGPIFTDDDLIITSQSITVVSYYIRLASAIG